MEYINDCDTDKMILNKKAVKKESTVNPPTILSHTKIINALITNKNRPRVIKVMGKVKSIKIGLINTFNNPNTTATIKAVVKPAT